MCKHLNELISRQIFLMPPYTLLLEFSFPKSTTMHSGRSPFRDACLMWALIPATSHLPYPLIRGGETLRMRLDKQQHG
jgi:hypothetical protein